MENSLIQATNALRLATEIPAVGSPMHSGLRTRDETGRDDPMKRTFALAALLAALGVLFKLSYKTVGPSGESSASAPMVVPGTVVLSEPDPKTDLLAKYRGDIPQVRDLVARVAERFGRNAIAIERTDGLNGLILLDRLDLEAVFLYEKHPTDFRRLRDLLGTDAAADLLLHWREYFGFKRADETDRGILIAEIASLTPAQQQLAARHPTVLPLILADPKGMTELAERMADDEQGLGDVLAVLSFISLEQGASDLRSALRTLENHGPIALEALRRHGLEGFALVSLYGPVLEALGNAMPLDQSLILLRVNADTIDDLLRTHRPETVAGHLRHVAAVGLIEAVGGSPNGLRLVVEHGEPGERALRRAGADAADVVFVDFDDPTLQNQAVSALGTHGFVALAMLDKYSHDPDFRQILRTQGAAIIPPIAQADAGPDTIAFLQSKTRRSFTESLALAALFASGDNGQAMIQTIKNDGLGRVSELNQSEVRFYQFLPLYDVIHLGNVLGRGYTPTSSEMTWALLDGCFVVADALSLAAVQPEGAVAAEAVRAEVKASAREGAKSLGRGLAESGGSIASKRWARWWTVRSAGGIYQVLRRLPDALPRLTLAQLTEIARPLFARAGMRLTNWRPFRLLHQGTEVLFRIPPERGLKYLTAQALQASVGVVGFQKMEEHLASRRPQNQGQ